MQRSGVEPQSSARRGPSRISDNLKKLKIKENKLADLFIPFAIKAIEISNSVLGHYSLKNQLERSAISIGANIREASYTHSKADFI